MSLPRIVVLCLGTDQARTSLLQHEAALAAVGELHVVDVLARSDLPGTAKATLRGDDLLALARPLVLAEEMVDATDVILLDARTWLTDPESLIRDFAGGRAVTVVSALAEHFADAKPSTSARLEAGFGRASAAAVRVTRTAATPHLLREWRDVVLAAYLRGPSISVAEAERDLLSAWPGGRPGSVAFSTTPLVCRWSDLTDLEAAPPLVDLRGLAEHLQQEDVSLDLVGQRAQHPRVIDALRAAVGPVAVLDRPWTWNDERPLIPEVLDLARAVDPLGVRFPDPRGTDFRGWLEQEVGGMSRFGWALYWSRPDLRASYPLDDAVDVLAAWFDEHRLTPDPGRAGSAPAQGVARAARAVTRRIEDRVSRRPRLGDPRSGTLAQRGVNLVGFLGAGSGLGTAARATLRALESLGVPHSVVDLTERVYSPRVSVDLTEHGAPYDVTLLHVNPSEVLGYAEEDLAYRIGGATRTVGVWFWETDRVPTGWLPAFGAVDEVWASSGFLREVFSAAGTAPVVQVPLPVDPPTTTAADRGAFGLSPTATVVTFVCDAFSGTVRKNPLGAVAAFREAFTPDDDAELVLKITNLDKFPGYERGLRRAIGDARVRVIAEHIPRSDLETLLASSDIYLSLHAAEGYGLTVLEAMAHGLPVIATDFGGTRDFVRHGHNALTVPYTLVDARGGPGDVYSASGRWAVPDTNAAASHLRALHGDLELARRLGRAGAVTAAERSPAAYALVIAERLRSAGLDI